jgi:periplasmic divalent cation tolerance protein
LKKNAVVVFLTAPNVRESKRLANVLVAERLAACVNILSGVTSVYRWQGKIEEASELLLLAKTTRARLPALIRRVKSLHSYAIPEIIAVPVLAGSPAYLSWIAKEMRLGSEG